MLVPFMHFVFSYELRRDDVWVYTINKRGTSFPLVPNVLVLWQLLSILNFEEDKELVTGHWVQTSGDRSGPFCRKCLSAKKI